MLNIQINKRLGGRQYIRIFTVLFMCSILFVSSFISTKSYAQYNAFEDPGTASKGAGGGPNLKAEKEKVEGGKVAIGTTSYVVTLFENNGTASVSITGAKLYPSSGVTAEVSLNQCGEKPVPPGAKCAITIAVSAMQKGAYTVGLLVGHTGRTGLVKASITGSVDSGAVTEGVVQGDVEAIPEVIDFGSTEVGQPFVQSITLRNKTAKAVTIRDIRMEAPSQAGLSLNTECPEELGPGEGCTVLVTWLPVLRGKSQGILIVEHSAAPNIVQVKITGEFNPSAVSSATIYPDSVANMGILVSDQETIDFGSGIDAKSAITASLVNAGDKPLTIYDVRLSGADGGLSLSRSGCRAGTALDPIEACPLIVTWSPNREGPLVDDILIRHSGARGILVLPVRGDADRAVDRDNVAIQQGDGYDGGEIFSDTVPVLDSYVVTSLAKNRAVISGPVGIQLVRDGERVVLAGASWDVNIIDNGVELDGRSGKVLLVFDRSLTGVTDNLRLFSTTSSSSSSSSSNSSSNSNSNSSSSRNSNNRN